MKRRAGSDPVTVEFKTLFKSSQSQTTTPPPGESCSPRIDGEDEAAHQKPR